MELTAIGFLVLAIIVYVVYKLIAGFIKWLIIIGLIVLALYYYSENKRTVKNKVNKYISFVTK